MYIWRPYKAITGLNLQFVLLLSIASFSVSLAVSVLSDSDSCCSTDSRCSIFLRWSSTSASNATLSFSFADNTLSCSNTILVLNFICIKSHPCYYQGIKTPQDIDLHTLPVLPEETLRHSLQAGLLLHDFFLTKSDLMWLENLHHSSNLCHNFWFNVVWHRPCLSYVGGQHKVTSLSCHQPYLWIDTTGDVSSGSFSFL